ncbi:type IV secretory pathway TrbL component [Rhodococcus sp. PvP016]|uniref:Type IV secretory pathway TrbL component n=2 Tax=Mycobacteriales TaxID=85007 RepID=A0ABS2KWS0_9NOCA|nr:type IV secretory pathway TrbL component [Rhodococcus corynebacterioides]MBP1114620.1 type IV secretory pathway TrbL component [Rhodococcus sp. PvP016]
MTDQTPASTPSPDSSGPPLRALAMVLLSLAVVFAGLGFFSLTGSGEDTPTSTAAAVTTTAAAAAPAAPQSDASAGSAATTTTSAPSSTTAAAQSLRVLNNSNVSGLAAEVAQTLESAGFTVGETGNYSSGTIAASTVYYDPSVPGQQAEAERIATTLGFGVEPRFEGIESSTPGIIVIVTG